MSNSTNLSKAEDAAGKPAKTNEDALADQVKTLSDKIEGMEKEKLSSSGNSAGVAPVGLSSRDIADKQLEILLTTHKGEAPEDIKLRENLRDLRLGLLTGSGDVPPEKIVETATSLVDARFEKTRATGTDGSAETALEIFRPKDVLGSQGFGMHRYVDGAMRHALQAGKKSISSLEDLGGSEEAEYLSGSLRNRLAKGDPVLEKNIQQAKLQAKNPETCSVIPIPTAALGFGLSGRQFMKANNVVSLAQTYGTGDITGYRERDFRPDLYVDFPRPMLALDRLGADSIMVKNDITVPRMTAAQTSQWVAENAAASDQSVTLTGTQSTAHRQSLVTDISWLLLSGGDQIGIQEKVQMQMSQATMQLREQAAFGKAATNGPNGLGGWASTNAPSGVTGIPDSLPDIEAFFSALQEDNIPLDMAKFLMHVSARSTLVTNLTHANSSSFFARPIMDTSMVRGSGDTMGGAYDGYIEGRPACISNNVPTNLESSDDKTLFAYGVFEYLLVIDYDHAYLVVDNLSQAVNGRDRISISVFQDVMVRFPDAFVVHTH